MQGMLDEALVFGGMRAGVGVDDQEAEVAAIESRAGPEVSAGIYEGAEVSGTVYAICAGSAIKLGFTQNSVQSRLDSLQTGSFRNLGIAAEIDGSLEHERYLQSVIDDSHIRGEWYYPTDKVSRLIEGMRAYDSCDELIAALDDLGVSAETPGQKRKALRAENAQLRAVIKGVEDFLESRVGRDPSSIHYFCEDLLMDIDGDMMARGLRKRRAKK